MTRRLAGAVIVCVTVGLTVATLAQAPAAQKLPLDNLGLEHLDIIVPDPAASAKFYARVFKTTLHQQPVRDTLRYFVLLGDLPQDLLDAWASELNPRNVAEEYIHWDGNGSNE